MPPYFPSPYASSRNGETQDATTTSPSDDVTSPTALRKLVLNYLLHHCYIDTAHAFAKDGASSSSSTAPLNGDEITTEPESHRALGSTSRSAGRTNHPLSAPPLSRQDSSMEVEGDGLLAIFAGGRRTQGHSSEAAGEASSTSAVADDADEVMGDAQRDAGHSVGNGFASRSGDGEGSASDAAFVEAFDFELSAEDLHIVRLRQEIRDHILAGRIRHATELLNINFPSVLNADADTLSGSSSSTYSRKASGTKSSGSGSRSSAKSYSLPSGPTSLEPQHLALNLQIQAFIESVRAANSPTNMSSSAMSITNGGGSTSTGSHIMSSSNPTLTSSSTQAPISPAPHHGLAHAPAISAAAAASISRSSSPAPSSASSTSSSASHPSGMPSALSSALGNAQLLYASVQRLKNGPYKDLYKKEIESVTAILAYKDLERSPLKKYLDMKRRKSLADQINSAIMYRSGRPSQPLIESAVRQTTFVWSQLHNESVAVPHDHPVFSRGTGATGFSTSTVGGSGFEGSAFSLSWVMPVDSTGAGTGGDKKGKGKVPSTFYLTSFLAER